jgi:hypothetical protein
MDDKDLTTMGGSEPDSVYFVFAENEQTRAGFRVIVADGPNDTIVIGMRLRVEPKEGPLTDEQIANWGIEFDRVDEKRASIEFLYGVPTKDRTELVAAMPSNRFSESMTAVLAQLVDPDAFTLTVEKTEEILATTYRDIVFPEAQDVDAYIMKRALHEFVTMDVEKVTRH